MAYYTSTYEEEQKKNPAVTGQNAYQSSTPDKMYGDGYTSNDPSVQSRLAQMQQQTLASASKPAYTAEALRMSGGATAQQAEAMKTPTAGSPAAAALASVQSKPYYDTVQSVPYGSGQAFTPTFQTANVQLPTSSFGQGTVNQQPAFGQQMVNPSATAQALNAQRTADGGYSGLSQLQAQTLFGNDFTGLTQGSDGGYSITADALRSRGSSAGNFTPTLVDLGGGQYTVTRPTAWTQQDEGMMQAYAKELQSLQNEIATPGASPVAAAQAKPRMEYLMQELNNMGQRKQAYSLAGAQDYSGLSDEEYLQGLVTNPNVTGTALDNAYQALGLNQNTYRQQAQKAATAAAEAAQNTIRKNYTDDRDRLIAQLAQRGLVAGQDSYADQQLRELDSKYRDLQQAEDAKSQAAMLAVDEKTRAYLMGLADKRAEEAHKNIADQVALANARANAYSKTTNADVNAAKLDIAAEKNRIDEEYKQGRISLDQYRAEIDRLDKESLAQLRESQGTLAEANAAYTSGAKTENTQANTAYTQARTETENALRDAKLAKLQAEAAKLWRSGSSSGGAGAAPTEEELLGAQQMFQGQGGTGILSGKKLQDAIKIYRAARSLNDANVSDSPSLQGAINDKASYNKTTRPPSSNSDYTPLYTRK